jgi:hypothetical protein
MAHSDPQLLTTVVDINFYDSPRRYSTRWPRQRRARVLYWSRARIIGGRMVVAIARTLRAFCWGDRDGPDGVVPWFSETSHNRGVLTSRQVHAHTREWWLSNGAHGPVAGWLVGSPYRHQGEIGPTWWRHKLGRGREIGPGGGIPFLISSFLFHFYFQILNSKADLNRVWISNLLQYLVKDPRCHANFILFIYWLIIHQDKSFYIRNY